MIGGHYHHSNTLGPLAEDRSFFDCATRRSEPVFRRRRSDRLISIFHRSLALISNQSDRDHVYDDDGVRRLFVFGDPAGRLIKNR